MAVKDGAQESERHCRTMTAEVGLSISFMPGPPFGPSYRMTKTIPFSMVPARWCSGVAQRHQHAGAYTRICVHMETRGVGMFPRADGSIAAAAAAASKLAPSATAVITSSSCSKTLAGPSKIRPCKTGPQPISAAKTQKEKPGVIALIRELLDRRTAWEVGCSDGVSGRVGLAAEPR